MGECQLLSTTQSAQLKYGKNSDQSKILLIELVTFPSIKPRKIWAGETRRYGIKRLDTVAEKTLILTLMLTLMLMYARFTFKYSQHKHKHKEIEKVPFLVLMLLLMSRCEPALVNI